MCLCLCFCECLERDWPVIDQIQEIAAAHVSCHSSRERAGKKSKDVHTCAHPNTIITKETQHADTLFAVINCPIY